MEMHFVSIKNRKNITHASSRTVPRRLKMMGSGWLKHPWAIDWVSLNPVNVTLILSSSRLPPSSGPIMWVIRVALDLMEVSGW